MPPAERRRRAAEAEPLRQLAAAAVEPQAEAVTLAESMVDDHTGLRLLHFLAGVELRGGGHGLARIGFGLRTGQSSGSSASGWLK
jgi:hypothetical protein